MTTYACPKGHTSSTDDFCDECGAKIAGTATPQPAAQPTAAQPTAAQPTAAHSSPAQPSPGQSTPWTQSPAGELCPNCGTPRAGSVRFCEDCGYDHTTGKVPVLAAPVPAPTGAPTGGWTATVRADRKYFEDNAIEGVEFPADPGERLITLPIPQVRIGRRSNSKGTNPEIDLADTDPGASHSHALLTFSVDGTWLVSDLGSTNGTWLNQERRPLTAGQTLPLKDGDEVHVGAWTTITLHAPTP